MSTHSAAHNPIAKRQYANWQTTDQKQFYFAHNPPQIAT
ncbi:hypothetical protein Fuma_04739 [Fuerstiella marisgermanici]|uniref:Uncharacterized protein n=1 Tax=Fuerstiella marisgermanici TaxID=1891926 RepID=A0A1P8WLZ7_9PLAN|nr:hypothetical protein Fuma_04739 [Fuerstiella marisgermanici]